MEWMSGGSLVHHGSFTASGASWPCREGGMANQRMARDGGSVVVPRWEWRVFGVTLPLTPGRLQAAVSGPERESAEYYLLSRASPHNVKIRGGAVEVKRLEEVHPSGLERWRPTLKAPFPLDAGSLTEVWDVLGIPSQPQPMS